MRRIGIALVLSTAGITAAVVLVSTVRDWQRERAIREALDAENRRFETLADDYLARLADGFETDEAAQQLHRDFDRQVRRSPFKMGLAGPRRFFAQWSLYYWTFHDSDFYTPQPYPEGADASDARSVTGFMPQGVYYANRADCLAFLDTFGAHRPDERVSNRSFDYCAQVLAEEK